MWDIILSIVILLAIGAMVFFPTTGPAQEPKCSSCPKKAARDAMASQ